MKKHLRVHLEKSARKIEQSEAVWRRLACHVDGVNSTSE